MESGAQQGHLITQELWQPRESCQEKPCCFKEHKLITWGSPSFLVLSKRTNGRGRWKQQWQNQVAWHALIEGRESMGCTQGWGLPMQTGARTARTPGGHHGILDQNVPPSKGQSHVLPVTPRARQAPCLCRHGSPAQCWLQTGEEPAHSEACQGSHALPETGWQRRYQERAHSFNYIKTITYVQWHRVLTKGHILI